jgi:hypothetical protein
LHAILHSSSLDIMHSSSLDIMHPFWITLEHAACGFWTSHPIK